MNLRGMLSCLLSINLPRFERVRQCNAHRSAFKRNRTVTWFELVQFIDELTQTKFLFAERASLLERGHYGFYVLSDQRTHTD